MTSVWYYVIPMILGRTYDMRTDKPGVDVFPQAEIDRATVIERHFTDSQYRIVEDQQEARDFLDVTGDLSLKIKTGRVNLEGLGNYLKESQNRANMVEILVKVHYETVTYTLPSTAKPREGWKTMDKISVGTHYVRSIIYGGDMVASLKFTGKRATDRSKIKAAVQANLQADTGSFGLGIAGNFSQLQEDLQDTSTLEINYYATVPVKGVPNTMESLIDLVEEFPSQTKLVNNGTGVPLRMELFPLTALDADIPLYIETKALVDQLDLLEEQFDDIRSTKVQFQEWTMKVPPVLDQDITDEIGEFNDKLENISSVFYKVLGNLNLDEGADTKQFQLAFDAYEGNDGTLPDKYYRKMVLLRNKIVQSTPELKLDVGGTTYTHWGQATCNSAGITTLFSGIIVSTDSPKGGSSQTICLNDKPYWHEHSETDVKKHPKFSSKLAPLRMEGREGPNNEAIYCSTCHVADRTSSWTFPGQTKCPEGWSLEYEGYIATKSLKSRKGEFLCMDRKVQIGPQKIIHAERAQDGDVLADVKLSCGTLPCSEYTKDNLLPCIVCSY